MKLENEINKMFENIPNSVVMDFSIFDGLRDNVIRAVRANKAKKKHKKIDEITHCEIRFVSESGKISKTFNATIQHNDCNTGYYYMLSPEEIDSFMIKMPVMINNADIFNPFKDK